MDYNKFFEQSQQDLSHNEKILIRSKTIKLKSYANSLHSILKSGKIKIDGSPIDKMKWVSYKGDTFYDFTNFLNELRRCNSNIIRTDKRIINITACNNYSLCPLCCAKKRADTVRKVIPAINELIKEKYFIYVAVATQKDSSKEDYDKLRKSWKMFCDLGRSKKNEAFKIKGYIQSIEIKPKQAGFHTHAHLILVCNQELDYKVYFPDKKRELKKKYGNDIPKDELDKIRIYPDGKSKFIKEWELCSPGATNFSIRPLKKNVVVKDIEEQVKYFVKTSELNESELFNLWAFLRDKKRLTISGILKDKMNKSKKFDEEEKVKIKNEERKEIPDVHTINYYEKEYKLSSSYKNEKILEWYKSDEYQNLMGERNRVIAETKNAKKNYFEKYKNGEIDSREYNITVRELIIDRRKRIKVLNQIYFSQFEKLHDKINQIREETHEPKFHVEHFEDIENYF